MNWDAIGAVSEGLGAIAVFVTLAYLAVQVRQTRDAMRNSVAERRWDTVRNLSAQLVDNERLNDVMVRVLTALDEPVPDFMARLIESTGIGVEEAAMVNNYLTEWWAYRVEFISQIDNVTPEERAEFNAGVRQQFGSRLFRLWLETNRHRQPQSAMRYIDGVLGQPG